MSKAILQLSQTGTSRHLLLLPHDHHYRECEVDRLIFSASTDAEAVHPNVLLEGLADAVGVTGIREGPGQKIHQRFVQPGE